LVAVEVALPPSVSPIDAVALLLVPLAVALVAPLDDWAFAEVFSPDAELTALLLFFAWAYAKAFSPFAVAAALPPLSATEFASPFSPDAVAAAIPPPYAPAFASSFVPDAELFAVLSSCAYDDAWPWSEPWAVALLGAPVEASQIASVPSVFVSVTFVLVVEHDSRSDFANASVRATMSASTTTATAAPI
jgi:hypothetical protein